MKEPNDHFREKKNDLIGLRELFLQGHDPALQAFDDLARC